MNVVLTAWHETQSSRLITGRVNAWFKGYIEVTDDLSENGTLVYNSDGGKVLGLARDRDDADRYYACTWQDISPAIPVR